MTNSTLREKLLESLVVCSIIIDLHMRSFHDDLIKKKAGIMHVSSSEWFEVIRGYPLKVTALF